MIIIKKGAKRKEVFIDLSAGSNGTGTYASPYNAMGSVPWQNKIKLRFKRGVTHQTPVAWWSIEIPGSVQADVEFTDYGDAAGRAWLDGSVQRSDWTATGINGVYERTSSGDSGQVCEMVDGEMQVLTWQPWQAGGRDATAALMQPGTYSHNQSATVKHLVKPWNSDNPNTTNSVWVAQAVIGIARAGAFLDTLRVRNLGLRNYSRQGSNVGNLTQAMYSNLDVRFCGGHWNNAASYFVGGGLQCTTGTDGLWWIDNTIKSVWDASLSPQSYSPSTGSIKNVYIQNNILDGFGYSGVEISAWSENGPEEFDNIVIEGNKISNGGYDFANHVAVIGGSQGRTTADPSGVKMTGAPTACTNIIIRDNDITHCTGQGIYNAGFNGNTDMVIERNRISDVGYNGILNRENNNVHANMNAYLNEIDNVGAAGIRHEVRDATTSSYIRRNTIRGAGTDGILVTTTNANAPYIYDNVIDGCQRGIRHDGGTAAIVTGYNNVANASTADYSGFTPAGTNQTLTSGFVDVRSADVRPFVTSPLLGQASGLTGGPGTLDNAGLPFVTNDIGCHRGSGLAQVPNRINEAQYFSDWAIISAGTIKGAPHELAPNGDKRVQVFTEDLTNSALRRVQQDSFSLLTDDTVYRFSFFAKAVDVSRRSWLWVQVNNKTPNYWGGYFDLDTMAAGSQFGTAGTGLIDHGDGWGECYVDVDVENGAAAPVLQIRLVTGNGLNTTAFDGSGMDAFYLSSALCVVAP